MDFATLKSLIVDDYELSRVSLRMKLKTMGFKSERVDEASGGQEAIDRIQSSIASGEPYDCIFCDWMMPDVDGLQVLVWLRQQSAVRSTPFIMVTAEIEQKSIVEALENGASEYVCKPVELASLEKKVRSVLGN